MPSTLEYLPWYEKCVVHQSIMLRIQNIIIFLCKAHTRSITRIFVSHSLASAV